ncbi:MAG: 50S ribosomal protein L23 [Erysipelotrichaceae bacterium]|nr:50S ribosomal protein L23 [Erysipelotrichaceae bacterium]MBR3151897.1 50S ribosomal protein L23 [Erysipelotrichaceae bacterium]MBR3167399.1 50S ribosomal protein L23 [Erysipelotrichaceae bacterium]
MSNAKELIIKPVVTEKSLKIQEENNTVVFEVEKSMNKIHVKQAIEEIYNVKVESVNIVNTKSKTKRVGRYTGKTHAFKKAYIKLAPGSSITILGDK